MKMHSEFLPQLAAYHDGALPAEQRESVASHVRDCPLCQRLLEDWRALDGAIKALPEPTAETDGIRAQVLSRISPAAETVTTVQSGRSIRIPIRIWATAAAAAVVLVGTTLLMRDGGEMPEAPAFADREVPAKPSTESQEKGALTENDAERNVRPGAAENRSLAVADPATPTDMAEPAAVTPEPSNQKASTETLADNSSSAAAFDQSTAGDSGILQSEETSTRLAVLVAPEGPDPIEVHFRVPNLLDPAIVDVNLRPVFDVAFEGIGYAPTDMLAEAYDPSLAQPRRLSPQVAYMVSSMRMERSVLLSRTTNQVRSPETQLRLAEITWRLANMTADQDDVRNAIVAQTAAMRAVPSFTTQSLARLAHLRSLQQ